MKNPGHGGPGWIDSSIGARQTKAHGRAHSQLRGRASANGRSSSQSPGKQRTLMLMTTRERLHKLVDELPDDAAAEALALISDLAEPDDGHLSNEDIAALDEAEAAIAAGQVRPLADARRDLGL
jgi:hypothetical protein